MIPPGKHSDEKETEVIDGVSVILLSFNGQQYLTKKIDFLRRELSGFDKHELIIIDDRSEDGSIEVLQGFLAADGLRVLVNDRQSGIPYSMNRGVAEARYAIIVFCDQRQELSSGILQKIVEPLQFEAIGAVSACISSFGKERRCSSIRRHENTLKRLESNMGNLMGVYGPLYALKKQCYSPIPNHIILDDLYLSLLILKSKQIILREDCFIIDDDFSILYDYKRIKRYLAGFLQILKERQLLGGLSNRQRIMLIWHKYIRLLIPLLLFLCYIASGFMAIGSNVFLILFGIVSFVGLLSLLTFRFDFPVYPKNLIRMNIFYVIGSMEVFIDKAFRSNQTMNGKTGEAFVAKKPHAAITVDKHDNFS